MQKLKVLVQGDYGSPDKLCIAVLSEGDVDINHPQLKTRYSFGERIVLDKSLFNVKSFENHFVGNLYVDNDGLFSLEHLNEGFVLLGKRSKYSDGESMGGFPESTISYILPWSDFISGGKGIVHLESAKDTQFFKGRKSVPKITIINGYRGRFTNHEIVKCDKISSQELSVFETIFYGNLNKNKTDEEIHLEQEINDALNSCEYNYKEIPSELPFWEYFNGKYNKDDVNRIILFEYKGDYSDDDLETILPCLDIGLSKAMIVSENDKRYIHIEACYLL